MRLRVGAGQILDVKANDTDPDGDDMTITLPSAATERRFGQPSESAACSSHCNPARSP